MERTILCCSRCGATNFANMAGLMGHMKNSTCRILGQMTSVPLSVVPPTSSHSVSPLANSHIVRDEHGASMDSPEMLHPLEMIKETPVALQYDVTFEIIRFFRSCNNNEGLSNKDIDCLLSILWHQEFDTSKLTIRTSSDIRQYEEQLYSEEDGWQSHTLSQKENEDPIVFQFKDPMVALTNLFSSPEVAEDFKLQPSIIRNESGERVYSSLDTCEWWEEMQIYINLRCEGAIISPIILYSDQTTLSNNRRVLGHPIVMSIGNISCHVRELDEGHTLIGLLPIFSDMNVSQDRKLEMFQECLDIIFKPLKVASHEGVALIDPFGTPQFVFPLLYAYSCDHPEGCKISCTYDTNKSSSPCSNCMCGKDSLSDVHLTFRSRTEEKMKEIYRAMTIDNLPRGESKKISKSWSVHRVECAFWNFNGGDTRLGNPYLAIHVDILHQSDVGIFKMLVDIIREMVPSTTLIQLDQRLFHIRDKCRYPGFRIPGSAKGGYFTSNANYAGFEHRAIMQVLMFCLIGLYDLGIIEVFALFMDWYSLACRSIEHTDGSLLQMETSMNRVVTAMKRSNLSDWQRSAFNTIKVHMMSHFDPCIRRSGLPWEYSTNMFEHMHIAIMKKAYRRSNKRNAALQIIKHNRQLEMLRTVGKQLQGFENIQVQRETILDKVVTLGVNVMSGAYVNIHRSWLTQDALDVSQTLRATMSDIQMGRGFDVATLPKKVQHLFHHQPEVPNYLSHALHSFELERGVQLPQVFGVSKTLAIPGGLGVRYGESPLYVRASHSFHGHPWYSSVALKMENPSEPETTWYGEVHLLMHFSVLDLALVKCYCELDEGELGHTLKCVELSWSIPRDYMASGLVTLMKTMLMSCENNAYSIASMFIALPFYNQRCNN